MEKSCAECSEPTLAQSLCTLCNKWLCYQCTDVHQHQKAPTTSHYGDSQPQEGPGASQRPELHPSSGQGPGSYPCPLLMCHSHRQEPLELFCESCDLLCCSSCHLSSHKNHRMVQISKALQDQQWLFESLMVRQEEKRSAVENNAKQMEDRLHGVKIAHRKAENQIKMAKMIMMNELNKRANLLIEQLQKISEDFQQRLEDQLQGAIEACGQLDHVQKFITWATKQHSRGPVLFSRALISLQMQQLLEPSIPSDCWSPIKIRFDWDASYWMKQISTLGQLTVEGGNCTYPQGMSCSSVHRPQPIACLALPTVCHRGREPGCGYQDCCEPHMCCLHGIASQPDPSGADKRQLEARFYNPSCNSSCVQPALTSASLPQRCWDPDSLAQCPPSSSPVPTMGPLPISCSRGSVSIPQATVSQPKAPMKSHLYYQDQIQIPPDSQAQSSAEHSRPGQCQEKLWTSTALQRDFSHKASDRDVMTEEIWQDRCRVEEVVGQTKSRDLLREDQQDRRIQQQQQLLASPAAELSKEQQRNRAAVMPRDHRDARRSTSLEVPMTTVECAPDGHGSRLSPGMVCTRRKRRSQSIPAELAAPSSTLYSDRPSGYAHTTEAESANKYASTGHTHRRASDGLLCVVKETSSDMTPSTGHRSPLLSYKTEPDHVCTLVNEEIDYDAKEKCRVSGNGQSSNTDVQKDSARPRVPVVCLERLKILVSQLPPHGRRQSDPLPASGTGKKETLLQRRSCPGPSKEVVAGGSETSRTTHSLKAPPHTEHQLDDQSPTLYSNSGFDHRGRTGSRTSSMLPHSDLKYVLKSHSAVDLDSDSDPRTASEEGVGDSWAESSSEAEPECLAEDMSVTTGAKGFCAETDIARDSEPSLGYEADPESDAGAGSEDGQGLEADGESGDAETESDTQPDCNPRFQAETDSDIVSDQHPDSHGSLESELNVESEREPATDDPQPLRSDLEEDSHFGSGPRQLLIANPAAHRDEEVQSDQDNADMESEDFCAVCLIGGDLLCCDRCPKVFHLSCHIPSLLSFPSGDWLCSLCRDVVLPEVEYDCENERRSGEQTVAPGLTACDQRNCERLTLVILSNVLSAPFQEPVSPLARHYYQIIKRPMDLSVIRAKLNRRNARHYNSPDQFVADVSLMFHNCAKFNYPDSEVAQAGRSLEAFFVSRLREVFPDRVFPADEADSDSDEYDEACRTAEGGFPWPESREQCFRKRKRRNSLKSRRHHF